jgi:hypothetical protein
MRKINPLLILLSGFLLAACSSKQPQISVQNAVFNFGDVVNGQVVSRDLSVHNLGSAPLLVESVSTSCGCTTSTLDPITVPPGGEAVLHIEFDSGAHGSELTGEVTRQVFIATNDPQKPEVVIEFIAYILPR